MEPTLPAILYRQVMRKLYGMTSDGGINNRGVIFSYDPFTTYTKLKDLYSQGSGYSYGSLDAGK